MKAEQNIVFQPENPEHLIQLQPRRLKILWWLLLLLLPLLLLIPIKRKVNIQLTEQITEKPVSYAQTTFTYPIRYLLRQKNFSTLQAMSDTTGKVIFTDIKLALWQHLFFGSDLVYVSAGNDCFKADSLANKFKVFPWQSFYNLNIPPISDNLEIVVIDADDAQPIPDAVVYLRTIIGEKSAIKSDTTNVNGTAQLSEIAVCGSFTIKAEKYGYQPDSMSTTLAEFLKLPVNERVLKLKPLKGAIKFIVKDLYTKALLPGVQATLTLEGGNSIVLKTNTNGVGVGMFDSVKLFSQAGLLLQKAFYNDTSKQFKVSEFIKWSDEERTFYLRPGKQSVAFKIIDAATGKPLPGAKVEITVNGKKRTEAEYSNTNGEFTVSGVLPDDVLSVTASKSGYTTNSSDIRSKKLAVLINGTQRSREVHLQTEAPPKVNPPKADDLKGKQGDLRINLQWYTKTDLDLHVYDPCGNEIWFSKRNATCGGGRGELDLDANAIIGTTTRPQENIYWLKPSSGTYRIEVVCFKYRDSGSQLPFNVSIVDKNGRKDLKGTIIKGSRTKLTVGSHTVN